MGAVKACALTSVVLLLSRSACAAPIANPGGLPPAALSLQYVLDQACLPIALGEKSEAETFGRMGMFHHPKKAQGLTGEQPAGWATNLNGISEITASERSCYFTVRGPDVAAYEAVATRIIFDRLGVIPIAVGETEMPPAVRVKGKVTGCGRDVSFYFVPLPLRFPSGQLVHSYDAKRTGIEVLISHKECGNL